MLRWDHRTLAERQAEWSRLHDEGPRIHAEALRLLNLSELDDRLHYICDYPQEVVQETLFQRETAHYPAGWLPRVLDELRYELVRVDLECEAARNRAESVFPRAVFQAADPFAHDTPPVSPEIKAKHQQILREEIQKASSGYVKRRLQQSLKSADH